MPMEGEKYHIVPYKKGYRVMSDNGTYFSNKPLTKTRARQQQKALYAAAKKGDIFHAPEYTIVNDPTGTQTILKGSGFIGDAFAIAKNAFKTSTRLLTRGTKAAVEGFKNRVVDVSKGVRNDYPPKAREVIAKYGDGVVESLMLRRQPIQSFINTALNFISKGKWNEVRQKYSYDKLFHLSLIASVKMPNGDLQQIIIEKNEVINISDSFSSASSVQFMQVPVPCCVTLQEFLKKGEVAMGSNYFIYDPFTANCQMYLKGLLDANDLSTPETTAFILQPMEELVKELPGYTKKVARALTDVAAVANVAIQGRGEEPKPKKGKKVITMKPTDFFHEHQKLVHLLDTMSDQLKAEAKDQAKEAKGWKKKLEGAGQSEYSKRHIEKLKAFAALPMEEQKRISAEAEARRATLVNPMVERNQRVAEYNAEMKRRTESSYYPVIDALVKAADASVGFLEKAPGVGKIAAEAYKAFAPPGSKFHGGADEKWIQEAVEDMKKGAFTAQAKRAKMTVEEFAKDVIAHPEKYQEKTRKRAQFYMNVQNKKGEGNCCGGSDGRYIGNQSDPMMIQRQDPKKSCCGGAIHDKFKSQLAEAGFTPEAYLKKARAAAKKEGYDSRALEFADDGVHKLMIYDDTGKVSKFGRVGYGDFIIWSKVDPKIAPKKRDVFHKSHSKIKGDWKNNKFSPNMLALKILW